MKSLIKTLAVGLFVASSAFAFAADNLTLTTTAVDGDAAHALPLPKPPCWPIRVCVIGAE